MVMAIVFSSFLIAIVGIVVNRTSLILILMSLELMLLSVSILLVVSSGVVDLIDGQLLVVSILTVAACESAMGLAIMVTYYRITGHISIKMINMLRG
nr:NADH dehydrogenase subunit 4L [Morbakka sp. MKL-2023]